MSLVVTPGNRIMKEHGGELGNSGRISTAEGAIGDGEGRDSMRKPVEEANGLIKERVGVLRIMSRIGM
ncbi:hypothetical protein BU24DRAFT_73246 [Aaosphaeria arxii CBS 175.79]|uniref:Uncharacterized protein n=1 Tax=Aaosphaeria arxii CBS 175.79 TaxID=1450172 RepID=A0A6A5XB74_9PLEO|nr:uncharacterized protein BU24DRAFT_73246 [Aaosphaeria arxii CBS 175.79]KAF2010222.1 hypothetical protein BU24DRAFT_73246 [Aaosphaeria arxii CBS 175.79]